MDRKKRKRHLHTVLSRFIPLCQALNI